MDASSPDSFGQPGPLSDQPVLVRQLGPGDLPAVLRMLHGDLTAPVWSDAEVLSLAVTAPPGTAGRYRRTWVAAPANDPGRLIGFAVASFLEGAGWAECEIEYIVVVNEARRRGAGQRLLQAILSAARQVSASAVQLEVRASNDAALRLYGSAGFGTTGRRPGYYGHPPEDALLLTLLLG